MLSGFRSGTEGFGIDKLEWSVSTGSLVFALIMSFDSDINLCSHTDVGIGSMDRSYGVNYVHFRNKNLTI